MKHISFFTKNRDKCIECGECLINCRFLDFSKEKAVEEIKLLNKGNFRLSHVIEKCTGCMACNTFCPENAFPYERIIFSRGLRLKLNGIPARGVYFLPDIKPNFRENLDYNKDERFLQEKWSEAFPPAGTVLYPGCNLLTMPLVATGIIFKKLPVWGKWDLCCGEIYFRLGLFDKVEKIAKKLSRFYKNTEIEEMVFICPACYNMFKNILPLQFGADFQFKKTFFTDWFLRELEKGNFEIKKQINKKVVIHDSCHGRALGVDFMKKQRMLLNLIGIETFDSSAVHRNSGCCGIAAGTKNFSPLSVISNGISQLLSLEKMEVDEISVYCSGCLLTFNCLKLLKPGGKKIVHTIEYIKTAIGDSSFLQCHKKSREILKGVMKHALINNLNSLKSFFEKLTL